MIRDISTMVWKESKGLLRFRGRRAQAILALLSPVMLAIYLPIQEGTRWIDGPLSILLSFVTPLILVGLSIPDSFAGERERHTLPTLLASRLSDRAILVGKIITCVGFGWGVTLALLLVSAVTLNAASWSGKVLFYSPTVLLADLAISFLVAMLTAAAGVLFSMRAATAQEAQQTLMAVLLIPPVILQFVLFAVLASDAAEARLREVLKAVSLAQVVVVIVATLVLVDAALLATAVVRFKRHRLIAN